MLKILITGPESSGKTQLAQTLARRFQSPWVPEFARTYLNALEQDYEEEDLLKILNGQLRLQHQHHQSPLLFCDTGPEVIYVWSKVKFGRVDPFIEASLRKYQYPLTFLCTPDLAWEPDPLREAPQQADRTQHFEEYQRILQQLGTPYLTVKGQGEARAAAAITAVQQLLNTSTKNQVSV
ncbi:AAA family ATPase [Lewinella cohaerens]|uniref:AAA family ATPase n=1 Tax=Lewinella cohaerens TaxID=70995 RepID=UPI000374A8AF|nr:ATP-binding protein [Lewinella cohaerens]